ncbi:hypothetical protein cypCar_00015062 [Cyprinus carpio]|nr:hypothetical protein cypCar_00015062 [Cyprinus carpio]
MIRYTEHYGTYFCGVAFANIFSFSTGTVLLVKGADLKPAVIQQSVLGVIKPGSNVTLRCSVEVKMCEKGIQLVYWYRRSSETIHPGMVYTHGDMNNEYEFNSERMPYFIIIGLAVLCTVSFTINILLCIPLRRKDRTPQQIQTTNDDTTRVQYRNTDDINYAALDLSTKRGQRKRPLEETTYSVPTLRDKI